jgi:hypothetical protein
MEELSEPLRKVLEKGEPVLLGEPVTEKTCALRKDLHAGRTKGSHRASSDPDMHISVIFRSF